MSINKNALRISRPRIVELSRTSSDPGSVGDFAVAQIEPGLAQFLNLSDSDGRRLGEGFAVDWIVPLSAAATAASAASSEHGGWTGFSLSANWSRPIHSGETVLGRSRIASVDPWRSGRTSETVSYESFGKESGELLARGTILYVTTSEKPARMISDESSDDARADAPIDQEPVQEPEQEAAAEVEVSDLFYLERPSLLNKTSAQEGRLSVGDSWYWRFPAGLFRLLINPIAGGQEPLGRGFHPFGYVSLGAALHAASEILGPEFRPASAEIRWLRFVSGRSDFHLHCELQTMTDQSVTLSSSFFEARTKAAQVWLTLSRTQSTDRALI